MLSSIGKGTRFSDVISKGVSVGAECILPEEVLQRHLNVSTEGIMAHFSMMEHLKSNAESTVAKSTAKVTSSIYAATGQDMGNCALGNNPQSRFTEHSGPGGGVKYSIWLPGLDLRTVNGGCELPTQKQCLEMMGCYGDDKVRRLAEIIAAFSAALDISSVGAIVAGKLNKAHRN